MPAQHPAAPPDARRLLALARRNARAAEAQVAALPADAQAALLASAPVGWRAALLDLVPQPEQVVPLLPAADVCTLARAVGLEDSGWLLSCASELQLQVAADLDAWSGWLPSQRRMGEWLAALADAGEQTLLRAARALDFEMLVLHLRARMHVALRENRNDWQAPAGAHSFDDNFYFIPRADGDDLADVLALLKALFAHDYWVYFRLAQGVLWELQSDAEEWALRWRKGRLLDLGFPDAEDTKRIYARPRTKPFDALPAAAPPAAALPPDAPDVRRVITAPRLPAAADSAHALFRALAELAEPERDPHRLDFLALANRVALADECPLGDPDVLPDAVEKAARVASRGLQHLARRHGLALGAALRRCGVEHLFRVGHKLQPEAPLKHSLKDAEAAELVSGEAEFNDADFVDAPDDT